MSLKILEFETRDNQYIFDGVSGSVFAVDEILLECIKLFDEFDEMVIREKLTKRFEDVLLIDAAIAFVKKMKNKGLFYDENEEDKKTNQSVEFDADILDKVLQLGYMQQLILNVTEDCNMRCKYCYLSEAYQFTRNRTSEMMSEQTAKKSLDYFFEWMRKFSRFNPGKTCAITFYGGEPLLNFGVIKYAIEYTKENAPLPYTFALTTNGLLLNADIIDYLVENNVFITVSLDGYKETHDRNRLDSGENGTYDRIVRNLRYFKDKYPTYQGITSSVVYDYKTDMVRLNEYFKENVEWIPRPAIVAMVSTNNTNYYDQFTEEDVTKYVNSYLQFRQEYIDKKALNGKVTPFMEVFWNMQLVNTIIKYGNGDKKYAFLPYTGACVPGMKLSVRPNGEIDMCEKINSTFSIGNIDKGLDIDKISHIIREYNKKVTRNCGQCPIAKQCPMCYVYCSKDNEFFTPNCEELKLIFKTNLSILYAILEVNPTAFDLFEYQKEWVLNS